MLNSITGSLVGAGSEVFTNFIQLMAGCIFSIPIGIGARWSVRRHTEVEISNLHRITLLLIVSSLGMLLPLNAFGIVPVLSTLIVSGMKLYIALPLLVANALFNLLAPFTEIGFRWNFEIGRVFISLITGVLSGVLLWKTNMDGQNLIRRAMIARYGIDEAQQFKILRYIGNCMLFAGVYIVGGVIINIFFYPHLLQVFKTWFYQNPVGYELGKVIARGNMFNIFFLTGLAIVDLLMNPIKLAALFTVLKPKGVAVYYLFYSICALVLAFSVFVR